MTPRVLIVDDEELIRSGLAAVLRHRGIDVVGTAAEGRAAVELARDLVPDVVLMDLRMPGWDGPRATREIVRLGLPSKVLVLTTFDLDEDLREALGAGACGYVCKSTTPDQPADSITSIGCLRTLDASSRVQLAVTAYESGLVRPGSTPG